MAYVTAYRPEKSGVAARLGDWIETIRKRRQQHHVERTTFNELSLLTDRDLADLGIHRSQIREIARNAARMI